MNEDSDNTSPANFSMRKISADDLPVDLDLAPLPKDDTKLDAQIVHWNDQVDRTGLRYVMAWIELGRRLRHKRAWFKAEVGHRAQPGRRVGTPTSKRRASRRIGLSGR